MPKGPLRTVFFVCNNDFLCFDTSRKQRRITMTLSENTTNFPFSKMLLINHTLQILARRLVLFHDTACLLLGSFRRVLFLERF